MARPLSAAAAAAAAAAAVAAAAAATAAAIELLGNAHSFKNKAIIQLVSTQS